MPNEGVTMTTEQRSDGSASDDGGPRAGWVPGFDTLANLRAFGEVQRQGLEAANQVIGRLVDQVDRSGPLFGAESGGSVGRRFAR